MTKFKKCVEIAMFDKDDNKIANLVLETKQVKGLAQIKRLEELEYDCDAMVKLNKAIIKIVTSLKNEYNTIFKSTNRYNGILTNYNKVTYIIIYNDYSDYIEKYNID